MNTNDSLPAGDQEAGKSVSGGISSADNLPADTDTVPQRLRSHLINADPLDALAQHVDGAFVLVVHVTADRNGRRCFLTAKAAERAARNALADGHNATVFLAELKPLWRLTGGEM